MADWEKARDWLKQESITIMSAKVRKNFIAGWQKLCGGTGDPRRKVWTRTKILSPNIRFFCRELRFAIYTLFGDLWATKVPFWVKNSATWARSALLHGIY